MSKRKAQATEKPRLSKEEKAAEKAYAKLPDNPDFNEVHFGLPKPNDFFPEWMTQRLRFLTYAKAVPCAHCGKTRKHHWTMLMAFSVATEPGPGDNPFMLKDHRAVHPPLTPVCRDHMMRPMMPKIHETETETQTTDTAPAETRPEAM